MCSTTRAAATTTSAATEGATTATTSAATLAATAAATTSVESNLAEVSSFRSAFVSSASQQTDVRKSNKILSSYSISSTSFALNISLRPVLPDRWFSKFHQKMAPAMFATADMSNGFSVLVGATADIQLLVSSFDKRNFSPSLAFVGFANNWCWEFLSIKNSREPILSTNFGQKSKYRY